MKQSKTAEFRFGEDGRVFLQRENSSRVIECGALRLVRDADGEVVEALLDRLVHRPTESQLGPFEVSGCVVTRLSRSATVGG